MKPVLLLPLLCFLVACANTQNGVSSDATASTTKKNTPTKSAAKLAGVYFASLPCPDCGSVRVNLMLDANNRYDKSEEITSTQAIYFESGQWRQKNGQILLLPDQMDSNEVSTIRLFRHDGNGLMLLDENGKDYTANSSRYRFEKK